MIDCREACELLALRFAQESEEGTRPALDAHLASCRACAAEAERIRMVLAAMRDDPAVDPGPVYWATFQSRLDERIGRRRRTVRRRALLGIAAALIAVAGLGRIVIQDRAAREAHRTPAAPGEAPALAGSAETRLEAALAGLASDPATAEAEAAVVLDSLVPSDPLALDDEILLLPPGGEQGVDRDAGSGARGAEELTSLKKVRLGREVA